MAGLCRVLGKGSVFCPSLYEEHTSEKLEIRNNHANGAVKVPVTEWHQENPSLSGREPVQGKCGAGQGM